MKAFSPPAPHRAKVRFVLLSCTSTFSLLVASVGCQTIQRQAEDLLAPNTDAATEITPEQSARAHFSTGVDLMQAEPPKLAEASSAFERALNLDDSLAVAHYNLGVVKERQGKVDAAAERYRKALALEPRLDIAVDNLGRILEAKGQSDAARRLYEKSLEAYPEAVGPRLRLARWAHRDGDFKLAAKLAREALQFDGQSVEAYRLLSLLYAENRKNQLARLIAVRGQKLSPGDAEFDFVLGRVAENENKVATARELYERVLARKPSHAASRHRLAALALHNRDWQTATKQLEALLETGEPHPSLWVNLGIARKGRGMFPEAAEAYQKALAVNAAYGPALFNLGILELRQMDQPEAAEGHLAKYLELSMAPEKVQPLLEEARTLIEAKKQEQRMMEEMARLEAEAAAAAGAAEATPVAAQEAPASTGAAEISDSEVEPSPPAEAEAIETPAEARAPSAEVAPKKRKKSSPNPPAPQKPAEPEKKPETDNAFFDD